MDIILTPATFSASRGCSHGVAEVGHLQMGGSPPRWPTFRASTTPFSQRAEPSPLWLGTLPKRRIRRGTTRISRVRCEKAKRGCASRVPLPPGATARRTRGVLVVRATPPFLALMRHWRGVDGPTDGPPTPPRCGEVALTTEIPAGRPSSRPGSRLEEQQTTDGKKGEARRIHTVR